MMTAAFCPNLTIPLNGTTKSTLRRPRVIASFASHDRLLAVPTKSPIPSASPSPTPTPIPKPTSSPPPPPQNNHSPDEPPTNRAPDFHANVGTVIDTLRADYPYLLTHPPDLCMFRDDIILSDAQGNQLTGKDAYRTVLFLLRAHARLFLTTSTLQITNMYYHEDTRPAVHVRWRLCAASRTWKSAHNHSPSIVDGISIYYLDTNGLVAEHAFETKIRSGPKVVIRPLFRRIVAVGHVAVETGMPVPRAFDNDGPWTSLNYANGEEVEFRPDNTETGNEEWGLVSDLKMWASLPTSVQLGLVQCAYQLMGDVECFQAGASYHLTF